MTSKKARKINTPTNIRLPKLKKLIPDWDLKKYFYASENDPKIERDLKKAESLYLNFAKKYAQANFTKDAKKLLLALSDYEKLISDPSGTRVLYYFHYRTALNAHDTIAEKKLNLYGDRLTKAGNAILFFELAIGKISKKDQRAYLKNPLLEHFHYYLSRVFLEAKHTLSEKEERILNLTSNSAINMWVSGTEKILSKRLVTFEKKSIPLPEAIELINAVVPKKKQLLWDGILNELEDIGEVAENEFNAIVTYKKTIDELRGYSEPYSATVLGYENNDKSVETLVDVVSTTGFDLSKKFYALKARYHNVQKIPYPNKYDAVGPELHIPYKEAVEIVREAFYATKHEYGDFFDTMLTNGNVDVFPKRGKRGGAFMSSEVNQPTFVFLNHTDNLKSLETLAHEMGHALHSSRSKTQTALYEGYSTTTAETASTLFENIVFNHMYEQANERERIALLHDRITRDISTIQRQISFYNYELDLHRTIRKNGAMTKEEMQKMMQKHLVAYLGPAVEVTERDGLSFVYVSHFRYGFYVYTYAYGILMSNIMAGRLLADPKYVSHIDTFLTSGGSATVEDIFKSIGINPLKRETFTESLASLERDIEEFKKYAQKTKA